MMACGTAAGRLSRVLGTQSPVERVSSYGLGRHRAGPWMNRCGLTSGKKSLVTAQNNNELKKNNQGVQQRSKLDTGARLEMFPGQAIKKKKKIPPSKKIGGACHRQADLLIRLLLSFWPLFFCRVLWGSRNSPLPPEAGLRLLRRPFLPPLAYTAS